MPPLNGWEIWRAAEKYEDEAVVEGWISGHFMPQEARQKARRVTFEFEVLLSPIGLKRFLVQHPLLMKCLF